MVMLGLAMARKIDLGNVLFIASKPAEAREQYELGMGQPDLGQGGFDLPPPLGVLTCQSKNPGLSSGPSNWVIFPGLFAISP